MIAIAQEMIVKDGRMTSEPGSRLERRHGDLKAQVPLLTATPCAAPQ